MHAFGAVRSHQAEMRAEKVVCAGLWMEWLLIGLVLPTNTVGWVNAVVSKETIMAGAV